MFNTKVTESIRKRTQTDRHQMRIVRNLAKIKATCQFWTIPQLKFDTEHLKVS